MELEPTENLINSFTESNDVNMKDVQDAEPLEELSVGETGREELKGPGKPREKIKRTNIPNWKRELEAAIQPRERLITDYELKRKPIKIL